MTEVMLAGSASQPTQTRTKSQPPLPRWNSLAGDALVLAAHDLENPIQAILLWSQYIERLAGTDVARAQDGARAISRCVQRMVGIVADMVDASRAGAGETLNLAPVSVRALFGNVRQELEIAARTRGVFLSFDEPEIPIWVRCDAARISRVLSNLAADAVRDAGVGGAVTITARASEGVVTFELTSDPAKWEGAANEDPEQGLGRYVASMLLGAHGSELSLIQRPDSATVTAFSLTRVDSSELR